LVSPRLAQVPSQVVELGRFPTSANFMSKQSVGALIGWRKIDLQNAREHACYKAKLIFTRPQPQPERINGTSSGRIYEV
jgi:hypothetical protein